MVLLTSSIVRVTSDFVVKFLNENVLDHNVRKDIVDRWLDQKNEKAMRDCVDGKCFSRNPPRVVSKYLYFCDDERRVLLDEINRGLIPNMNIRELTKELGRRWQKFVSETNGLETKSCSDQSIRNRIQAINDAYEKDKERYYRQKNEYICDADLNNRKLKRVKRKIVKGEKKMRVD